MFVGIQCLHCGIKVVICGDHRWSMPGTICDRSIPVQNFDLITFSRCQKRWGLNFSCENRNFGAEPKIFQGTVGRGKHISSVNRKSSHKSGPRSMLKIQTILLCCVRLGFHCAPHSCTEKTKAKNISLTYTGVDTKFFAVAWTAHHEANLCHPGARTKFQDPN